MRTRPPSDRTCLWHGCTKGLDGARALFTPERTTQKFCGKECQNARAAWRARRGSTVIDPLLNDDWPTVKEIQSQLLKETK